MKPKFLWLSHFNGLEITRIRNTFSVCMFYSEVDMLFSNANGMPLDDQRFKMEFIRARSRREAIQELKSRYNMQKIPNHKIGHGWGKDKNISWYKII
jgi:hypothetical protein